MSAPISIGRFALSVVSGGRLWIDGGNMFGVIPRVLWERKSKPDDQHRIRLDTNCFLVRTTDSLGLIDTGYGGESTPKFRQRHALEDGAPLLRNLATSGVNPHEIDWVVLTHLHFDHAGGATFRDETGRLRPTFPRARHIIQQTEWDDALAELPQLAGSYERSRLEILQKAGLVELIAGDQQIVSGITAELTGGHTRGHQIVRIQSGDESAVCPGDMCPTSAHLPTFWTMAYDQFPLAVRQQKPRILNDIIDHDRIALFSHDPDIVAARLILNSAHELATAPLEAH